MALPRLSAAVEAAAAGPAIHADVDAAVLRVCAAQRPRAPGCAEGADHGPHAATAPHVLYADVSACHASCGFTYLDTNSAMLLEFVPRGSCFVCVALGG